MDKIRQAIERARAERAGGESTEQPLDTRVGADFEPPAAPLGSAVEPIISAQEPVALPAGAAADGEGVVSDPANARVVAVVAAETLERGRVVVAGDEDEAVKAVRMLRTQVLQTLRDRGWRVVGVVSARSGDGRTTVAANLAVSIAADPRSSATLIDLDTSSPNAMAVFGIEPTSGIEEVARGATELDAAVVHVDNFAALRLMALRGAHTVPMGTIVGSPALEEALHQLKIRHPDGVIVLDMPAVLDSDDALRLSRLCDGLLFVVREGVTRRDEVVRALTLLRDRPVLGTVLNGSHTARRSPRRRAG